LSVTDPAHITTLTPVLAIDLTNPSINYY